MKRPTQDFNLDLALHGVWTNHQASQAHHRIPCIITAFRLRNLQFSPAKPRIRMDTPSTSSTPHLHISTWLHSSKSSGVGSHASWEPRSSERGKLFTGRKKKLQFIEFVIWSSMCFMMFYDLYDDSIEWCLMLFVLTKLDEDESLIWSPYLSSWSQSRMDFSWKKSEIWNLRCSDAQRCSWSSYFFAA